MRELDAKRRFIQAILDERLVLQRKSDAEIVEGLKACEIPALTNLEKPDEYDSYDFVLRMRMDRVKQSAVVELDGHIAEKQGEIDRLQGETGSSLWVADLAEFQQAWTVYSQERIASATSVAQSSSGAAAPKRRPPPKKSA
jgi:hypothetical protein